MMRTHVDAPHPSRARSIPAPVVRESRTPPRQWVEGGAQLSTPRLEGLRLAGVALAACAQLAFLLWAARAAIPQALNCDVCDTAYYYTAAAEIAKSGLLFANPYDGYRSYFAPLFIAVVARLGAAFGLGGMLASYSYGASTLFWLVSVGLMAWLSTRADARTFWMAAAATLLNPVLVVYVPYALQEGVLMACCLPLLFVWAGAKDLAAEKRAALVMLMALLAYIIRSSLVWWLLPSAAYAAWLLWPRSGRGTRRLASTAAILLAACLLVGPQIYISHEKSGSFNPYPSTTLLAQQIAWGITLLKVATVEDEGHWRGVTYWSPYLAEPEEDKTASFYVTHPVRGAFLVLSHVYAGFHYDEIKPYWRLDRIRPLTIWLVLSSALVFLGAARIASVVLARELDADRAYMIATLVLCAGSLAFVAAESRFGVIGFAMLSLLVSEWIAGRPSRAEWSRLAPGLLLYLALSFLYNTLLLQSADIRL